MRLLGVISALFLSQQAAMAGTYTAATCDYANVNGLINNTGGTQQHLAVDGDVINIPAGTCTWTTQLSVTVGISIIGAGSGSTTITEAVPTVSMLVVTIPSATSSTFRLSGITLAPGGQNVRYSLMQITGTCNSTTCSHIRLDSLNITGWKYAVDFSGQVSSVNNVFGVIDHITAGLPNGGVFMEISHGTYGGVGLYGDSSWASPDFWGTDNALYLETNTFTVPSGNGFSITDSGSGGGARFVGRFNTLQNANWQTHGTESGGRNRGARHVEIYNNALTFATGSGTAQVGLGLRSGTALVGNNSYDNGGSTTNGFMNSEVGANNYRDDNDFSPWGWCSGLGPWDNNDPTIYATGTVTATSLSATNLSVTDSTQTWTASQWVGYPPYSVIDMSRTSTISGANLAAQITSSTATNVSSTKYGYWNGGSGAIPFQVGDTYQIRRALNCIDRAGQGQGDLLSAYSPTPVGWLHQVLDPVYQWGGQYNFNPNLGWVASSNLRIKSNTDYYMQVSKSAQTSPTAPFNGTVGTGFGTLANRPTTCTPAVGYWATDQGSWNTSGSGGQGQLYVCNPTNTWSLYYTPYTYPHPLVSSAPPVAPIITTTSPLPGGTVGVAYSVQFTASGTAPITWSATGIPAGLTFSSAGLLSGTPTTEGGATINVTASNNAGTAGPMGFAITISPGATPTVGYTGTLSGVFH